jgi:hypothetical protein
LRYLEEFADKRSISDDKDHLKKLDPYLRSLKLDAIDMAVLQWFGSTAWDKAKQRASIEDFRFHDLRQTWGLVARAERHFVGGADGTGRMEILRDGAALCAPGPGETLLRGRTHRAAAVKARGPNATGRKRSKKCYVGATVSALMLGKFLIDWCARRDSNSRPPGS